LGQSDAAAVSSAKIAVLDGPVQLTLRATENQKVDKIVNDDSNSLSFGTARNRQ
jgi:hypothetical protein